MRSLNQISKNIFICFSIIFIHEVNAKDHIFLGSDVGDTNDPCDSGKVLEIAMHDSGINLARKVDTGFLAQKQKAGSARTKKLEKMDGTNSQRIALSAKR